MSKNVTTQEISKLTNERVTRRLTKRPQRLNDLMQFAVDRCTVGLRQGVPCIFECLTFDELHIDEHLLSISTPTIHFRYWNLLTQRVPNSPHALLLGDGERSSVFHKQVH